ncbi:MAG: efflux RND transporter permease subunit [Endomicrobium sp.]|jgi:HAE1 family hydrophobic/amphiphilic exporter-1|nr:efflux RND transporter permease subunit [Endomicrobium sp.]
MNLAKLAIKRPTFVSVLLMTVLILGVVSLNKLSVRMLPDVEFPYAGVITAYPGAGVEEIEQLVTKPIEDALSGVSGLKHSVSVNQDNLSIVFGEFELSKNPDVAAQEIKDKIGPIRRNLPEGIKDPIVIKADMNNFPLVTLSLKSANMRSKELYDFAYDVVSKDLAQVSGVSQINIIGGAKREIHVNVDKEKLKDHELTLTALSNKIKSNTLNVPAGKVNRGAQEISFRTMGEFKSVKQINDVVLNFIENDKPVTVKDVAEVEDGVADEISRARLDLKKDGKITYQPSILLYVYRQAKGNDVAVSDGIKKKIVQLNENYKKYESKPELTVVSDLARGTRNNIEDVKSAILEGVFLAIVVVYFFLGSWRSTFITVLALPNSLIGSFVFMHIFGFSLNVISLMSLSLAVGLLIDDAIVVRENIFRHYEEGADPVKAAIDGTNEVTLAVIATTSTVIAVFLPVAFLSGIMGQFFKEFGLTVVFAMGISIIDALTIAPMLSAYIIPEHNKNVLIKSNIGKAWGYVINIFRTLTVGWFNPAFNFIEKSYRRLVSFIVKENFVNVQTAKKKRFVVSWKFMILLIAVFMFLITILVSVKYLKRTFMPSSEWGEFNIGVTAKPGTSLDEMDKYSKQVEEIIMSESDIELISSAVGSEDMFTNLSNKTSMYVKMIPDNSRNILFENVKRFFSKKESKPVIKRMRTTSEMKDYLRNILKNKFGDELEFSILSQSLSGDSEFILELSGDDVSILHDAAKLLIEKFKTIPYFVDIHSNYKPGKSEIQIQTDPKKMESFGVNSFIVGSEVRAMIDGVVSGQYREKGLEYDIKVKLQNSQKDIVKSFDTVYVSNVNNKLIKLKNVAFIKEASAPTQIYRKDRSRYITIEGNIGKGGTIDEIQKQVSKILNEEKTDHKNLKKWENINFQFSGNAEGMTDMFESIIIAGALSIIFIFMVLASLYESVITPFTIMTSLPLAIIGGVLALLFSHQPIDMFTMIGMIMLLGIVAKNSILLVDCIQQQMHGGLSINDSIIKAGVIRLRPILMTSFAIIAGMLPTALGLSEVGKFRQGMGIVVIGGIISSTFLTLIVVPAIFEYMDKCRHSLRKIINKPDKRMIDYTENQLKEKDL